MGGTVMIQAIDRLFVRIRSIPFFWRLTLFTRILLAAGFIPTGTVKLLGHRFTTLPHDTPIGAFFEAMYQTGFYWRFIGASQVLAGLLLLVPRWAHLGALLFVPLMANIFVITVSLGFGGTPFVTGLMFLAVLYLCAWDYHRTRALLTERPWTAGPIPRPRLDPLERIGFWIFGASLFAVFGVTRSLVSPAWIRGFLISGTLAGLFTLARFVTAGRKLRP